MIIIEKLQLKKNGNYIDVISRFEIEGIPDSLWYRFPIKYEPFLVIENLDAPLVGLLFLGLKTGNNIQLKGAVSSRLLYNINHYLIKALCLSNQDYTEIKVYAEQTNEEDLNTEKAAGTGMSCGVDSFATYYDHLEESGSFKIKYFTYFNVGSHVNCRGKEDPNLYRKRLKSITDFAKQQNIELISVDSNLSEKLKMNFQQTHSLRSASCVLYLQKIFKNYYYSSAYRLDHFCLNSKDTSDFDLFNLQMLSTESTNFFSSAAQLSRVERTLLISDKPETYDKLDVCTNPQKDTPFINCSKCYKCLRTQLTLEIAGKLEQYRKVFDLKIYKEEKEKYIGQLRSKRSKSILDIEVLNYLNQANFKPDLKVHYYSGVYFWNYYSSKIKKGIKRKLQRT